jgi:hypothetical protein
VSFTQAAFEVVPPTENFAAVAPEIVREAASAVPEPVKPVITIVFVALRDTLGLSVRVMVFDCPGERLLSDIASEVQAGLAPSTVRDIFSAGIVIPYAAAVGCTGV